MKNGSLRFFVLLMLAASLGCGGNGASTRKPVFRATGTLTLFGAPMSGATVAFAPLDGQPTAFGTTDDQGKFTLTTYDFQDGAAEGRYKVIVSKLAAPGTAEAFVDSGADHEAAEAKAAGHSAGGSSSGTSLVPPQYTTAAQTPLTAEVRAGGENVFPFDLK